jgi:hypothetical protein
VKDLSCKGKWEWIAYRFIFNVQNYTKPGNSDIIMYHLQRSVNVGIFDKPHA